MGLFREESIGVLVAILVCALVIILAIPVGMYAAQSLTRTPDNDAGPVSARQAVWLTAVALTVQDTQGSVRLLSTAMRMRNEADAERICRYLPLIRDRLISLAAEGRITVTPDDVRVDDATLAALAAEMNALLRERGPQRVFLYDSTHPDRLPRSVKRSLRCVGDVLTAF